MKISSPYVPSVVLRRNEAGSYKMRLSIHVCKKFKQKRIELGLGNLDSPEAELLSILICKIFVCMGLCRNIGISFFHENPRTKFHYMESEFLSKKDHFVTRDNVKKIESSFENDESNDIYLIKNGKTHLFTFFANALPSNSLALIAVDIQKEKTVEAASYARKILSVIKKACTYTSPILRAMHFPAKKDNFLQSLNYKLISLNEQ